MTVHYIVVWRLEPESRQYSNLVDFLANKIGMQSFLPISSQPNHYRMVGTVLDIAYLLRTLLIAADCYAAGGIVSISVL